MKTVTLSMLTGLMFVASAAAASAAPAVMSGPLAVAYGPSVHESARVFIARYDEGRPYGVRFKALHDGFDPNGNGVHPAIGPITDQ